MTSPSPAPSGRLRPGCGNCHNCIGGGDCLYHGWWCRCEMCLRKWPCSGEKFCMCPRCSWCASCGNPTCYGECGVESMKHGLVGGRRKPDWKYTPNHEPPQFACEFCHSIGCDGLSCREAAKQPPEDHGVHHYVYRVGINYSFSQTHRWDEMFAVSVPIGWSLVPDEVHGVVLQSTFKKRLTPADAIMEFPVVMHNRRPVSGASR